MSSTPAALIYAELLSNIRQVSVIASLSTPSNPDTTATLSDDRLQLKLTHNGATVLLILPAQVAAVSCLQQPKLGVQEISWRLALPRTASANNGPGSADNAAAPWSASKLSEQSQVSCRKCGNILLAAGSAQSWKDLPSENWAEMMDFWHCHKPSVPKKGAANSYNDAHLEEKGYGANTRLMARRGVGFVDLTYFLLSKEDCPRVKV
jgi:ubiquitin-protein ligase E3 D